MKQTNVSALIGLLHDECILLDAAVNTLVLSIQKCKAIGVKPIYSFEEQESFDSLSSKFNRASDLFTQKLIRTCWMLMHESFAPFIDLMNLCEKMRIIADANQMIAIRDMRNQIAHEYIPEALFELVPEVMDLSQHLIENIYVCKQFIHKREWLVADNS